MSDTQTLAQAAVPWLQLIVTSSVLLLAGLAACLSLWAIPLIVVPQNKSRIMIAQFEEIIRRGFIMLQPSSRLLVVCLALLGFAMSRHPDPSIASRWKYHAAPAGLVLLQTAWYEIVFIFPINDQIAALKGKFEDPETQQLPPADHEKLLGLLRKWQTLQWGRILLPLVAGLLLLGGMR